MPRWYCEMVVKRITADEAQAWLREYFMRRQDVGLWKGIVNLALRPQNPFEPEKSRLPRRGFLFGAGVLLSAAAWFLYFNFVR